MNNETEEKLENILELEREALGSKIKARILLSKNANKRAMYKHENREELNPFRVLNAIESIGYLNAEHIVNIVQGYAKAKDEYKAFSYKLKKKQVVAFQASFKARVEVDYAKNDLLRNL